MTILQNFFYPKHTICFSQTNEDEPQLAIPSVTFFEPSFFPTECDFCNTIFQIFPIKCLMNTVGATIPAETTAPPSAVSAPGLLRAPSSSWRVSFEWHSLHCCGRARGQPDG